jgi:hypothetical protein
MSCILAFATGPLARAQSLSIPMAGHVPADAVAYFGWAGADSLSAKYEVSAMGDFIDHSNLPDIARQHVPKLWDQLSGTGANSKATAALQKVLPILWRHPVAIYGSRVTIDPNGMPHAAVGLVCDAGTDSAELAADIPAMWVGEGGPRVSVNGTTVTAILGEEPIVKHLAGVLARDEHFIATMKKLQPAPALALYVDGAAILKSAIESAATNPQASEIWPKVRDALGIANVKSFAMTDGFEGSNWVDMSALEAPGPRTGLLAAIEPKPIDPVLLARIPSSATSVSVVNFDLVKVFDTIADAMAVTKESDTAFHQGAGIATVVLGRNLRRQIIGPMGPQWVMYSDSASHAMVVMNHPSDADAAGDGIVSAMFGLSNLANGQIPGAAAKPVVSIDQKRVKGIDLTSAVMQVVSPTEAVKDKILYFGLATDSVVAAARAPATIPPNDLMHSPDFLLAEKNLGVSKFASFDYCDLPKTAPAAYGNFGKVADQLKPMLDAAKIDLPKVQLPPIDQLAAHLSPALSVSWADEQGVYSKSISPFPGSCDLLGDQQQSMTMVSTFAGAVAIAMPALGHARTQAARVQAMSNERQIGLGLMMWANDHKGNLPPDLGSIVSAGYMGKNVKIFLKPGSKTEVPAEIANGTNDQAAAWVNDHAEYVLLQAGRQLNKIGNATRTPTVLPADAEQSTEPVPVAFADGHAEMCAPERVKHFLHPDDGNE